MKQGICVKCQATDVYMIRRRGEQGGIFISGWLDAAVDYYICTKCGYTESYIMDEQELRKVQKNGVKVQPRQPT